MPYRQHVGCKRVRSLDSPEISLSIMPQTLHLRACLQDFGTFISARLLREALNTRLVSTASFFAVRF